METITLDKFFADYKPQINHIVRAKTNSDIADEDITSWSGCMYETYGEELDYINSFFKHRNLFLHQRQIWTIIENDDDLVVQAGYHLVNRMGYIVTEKSWNNENILVKD